MDLNGSVMFSHPLWLYSWIKSNQLLEKKNLQPNLVAQEHMILNHFSHLWHWKNLALLLFSQSFAIKFFNHRAFTIQQPHPKPTLNSYKGNLGLPEQGDMEQLATVYDKKISGLKVKKPWVWITALPFTISLAWGKSLNVSELWLYHLKSVHNMIHLTGFFQERHMRTLSNRNTNKGNALHECVCLFLS